MTSLHRLRFQALRTICDVESVIIAFSEDSFGAGWLLHLVLFLHQSLARPSQNITSTLIYHIVHSFIHDCFLVVELALLGRIRLLRDRHGRLHRPHPLHPSIDPHQPLPLPMPQSAADLSHGPAHRDRSQTPRFDRLQVQGVSGGGGG